MIPSDIEEKLKALGKELSALLHKHLGEDVRYSIDWMNEELGGRFTNVPSLAEDYMRENGIEDEPTHH